jgi:hypothetical protein
MPPTASILMRCCLSLFAASGARYELLWIPSHSLPYSMSSTDPKFCQQNWREHVGRTAREKIGDIVVVKPSTINLTNESADVSVGAIGEDRFVARASVATDKIARRGPVDRSIEGWLGHPHLMIR